MLLMTELALIFTQQVLFLDHQTFSPTNSRMQSQPNNEIQLIIGHKRPDFKIWSGHKFATLDPIDQNDFKLDDDFELKEALPDALIGEYYFLFLLRRQLEQISSIKSVTISQYRRFVTINPIGKPSENLTYSNVVSPTEASDTSISNLICPKKDGWLISSEFKNSPNVAFHYSKYHILRDWFRFLSDAFDANFLSQVEITEASLVDRMIPAPSNGVFPVQFFIEHLKRLELCALAFKNNGYLQRDSYQRRVIGFCLERLHSYFLLATLARLKINFNDVSGRQILVSESTAVKATI